MSKILEFDAILKENLKDIHFRRPDQTYEAVLGCMVVAYNRAIDDVQEELGRTVEYGWVERPFEFVKEDLESLKI